MSDDRATEYERENTVLRGIVANAKIPCVFCGKENMAECPKGFPGCAKADDILAAEEEFSIRMRAERDAAVARANTLAEALAPFAEGVEAFDRSESTYGDGPVFQRHANGAEWMFTVADARRAAAALGEARDD